METLSVSKELWVFKNLGTLSVIIQVPDIQQNMGILSKSKELWVFQSLGTLSVNIKVPDIQQNLGTLSVRKTISVLIFLELCQSIIVNQDKYRCTIL